MREERSRWRDVLGPEAIPYEAVDWEELTSRPSIREGQPVSPEERVMLDPGDTIGYDEIGDSHDPQEDEEGL